MLHISGVTVPPETRTRIELDVSRLPTGDWLSVPLEIVAGRKSGPTIWISAAVHGDELNGVEIIRRVLTRITPAELTGAVIAAPIVNVFGFLEQSRYLPDRRDLNRSFPGSNSGSLASRLAHRFLKDVVAHCQFGVDLHTGSHHRENLPQIRANLNDPRTLRLAQTFAAPVLIHASTRDGSLRHSASQRGVPVLVYEAGEPLRFNEESIRLAVDGILRVMAELGMRPKRPKAPKTPPLVVRGSRWVRARRGGILRLNVELGRRVNKSDRLGVVADVFGDDEVAVKSPIAGLVIGCTNNPLVNQGDAVVHLAELS